MMTNHDERSNADPDTKSLETQKRRLEAILRARRASICALVAEHQRITDLLANACLQLLEAKDDYLAVCGRLTISHRSA